MSAENVELVRSALFARPLDLVAVFVDGQFTELFEPNLFHSDLEVAFAQPSGPPTEYSGMEGLIEGWRDWLTPWATYAVDVEDFLDAGDVVVAFAVLRGETARDRVKIEQQAAALATVVDGRIKRLEFHLDRREALAAAGLAG
ncbi:MAG TPA: nuclear transport factor 2 family protein [Candidatus Dormibacteraeota bacterium]|nr:nuclear transport factor 2 family protein [Candidatus Dormibacteraeota bacterium]